MPFIKNTFIMFHLVHLVASYEDCSHFMIDKIKALRDVDLATPNRISELYLYMDYVVKNKIGFIPSKKTREILEELKKEIKENYLNVFIEYATTYKNCTQS